MLIFYCGTGWRSSVALLVALQLGLRAKNYDSGFYGWSWGGENRIAVKSNLALDSTDTSVASLVAKQPVDTPLAAASRR